MATIAHLITGLQTGGAERMLSLVAARLDRRRFRSVVVSMTDRGAIAATLDRAGIEVRSLGMTPGVPDPRGLFRLVRILREIRPDILQTWLYHADFMGLMAYRLGCAPHLLWNIRCSDMSGIALGRISSVLRRMLSRQSTSPDAIVVNSRTGQQFHESIGYRPRRWELLPNGFDTCELRPDLDTRQRFRNGLALSDDIILIGLPARYHPMKDHATFLAAAGRLAATRSQVRFLLTGSGVDADNRELARSIISHGISDRIWLLGERSDMARIYAALDIATSSSAYGEGFPNVLGEAMACGVPCVATDTGDTRLVIGETGIVVPPRDPAALASAWEQLIVLGRAGRRSLGMTARARIDGNYEIGSVVGGYEALYRDLVEGITFPQRIGSRAAAKNA